MSKKAQPLVGIVTPVYNGERYLKECIESVMAQTYENWEYGIINNCSTDRTLEIAEEYAARDNRIRIHNNESFVGMIRNWNIAVRQVSSESRYCKVMHADDVIFPTCIEEQVRVAEANPRVGIIGAYNLVGGDIKCTGIPFPASVISGKEICRAAFRGDYTVFGSPSGLLVRSDIVRNYKEFYDESILHADGEIGFRILKDYDFGFVHQILSYVRLHEDSVTSTFVARHSSLSLEWLGMLEKYGPAVFSKEEYRNVFRMSFKKYYRFLGKNVLLRRKKEFWDYHINGLRGIGHSFNIGKLIDGLLSELLFMIRNPDKTIERIKKHRRKRLLSQN